MIKTLLGKIPGAAWLREGWPDEARFVVQSAALREVLAQREIEGACLDAGCGEGLYASFLDSFSDVHRIVHMDVEQRDIARRFDNQRHQDVVGSVTAIPFGPDEFDACLCTEVMEHVKEDDKGFAELARVIKPGGILLISTPTPPAPFDPHHVREGYTFAEMQNKLERHGFDLVQHRYCFHWIMRTLLVVWRWQFQTLGRERRSCMPRFLVYLAGLMDRSMRIGKPWDIVVLARRRA